MSGGRRWRTRRRAWRIGSGSKKPGGQSADSECGRCGGEQPGRYFETSPCLPVEVLSSSTAHHDRRHKHAVYTAIPTLQTCLIVSQDERYVMEYSAWCRGLAHA
ncbi:Uma2 family endonuclease [Deinococcus apachensis]|uniref:Uma2 family endonuclease n=1 Tax=Deinococcus apachensis TaxID=309886 RepID=UPI001FDFD8E8|nr:Uma2 family endonuclease [Deinococcus apachensis]